MAIGKSLRRLKRKKRVKEEDIEIKLAPLEEQEQLPQTTQNNGGAIIVDTDNLKIPKAFTEEERRGARIFYLEKVVVVILILVLSFIAFITWLISIGPDTKP
jgi:uncharacterized membrane protein YdbT with pleckstrin-like domain